MRADNAGDDARAATLRTSGAPVLAGRTPGSGASSNVARHLREAALREPDRCALRVPPDGGAMMSAPRHLERTFAELDRETDAAAAYFARRGIVSGCRTLLLARPGLDLILSMFALLKLGAVPVAIDPGMGLRPFLRCVEGVRPGAVVGVPAALAVTWFFRGAFRDVETRVCIGTAGFGRRLREAAGTIPPGGFPLFCAAPETPAAVLFTSGSTGAPKGALYTHGMFDAQLALVREAYGIRPGEVDMPMLPVFALFNPALGATTVTPRMNPARPATMDPAHIVRVIERDGVTCSFGSPALWARIVRYCEPRGIVLPGVRRILSAGAPVHPRLLRSLRAVFPSAVVHTPYGATEVLPVSSIEAGEVLGGTWRETLRGGGTCVGRPLQGVRVRIIPVRDGPFSGADGIAGLPSGEVGEILVNAPSCTHEYYANPEATRLAKVRAPDGSVWHRMGDVGRLDQEGRLWFLGRKAEIVTTAAGPLYTEACEPVFNAHPRVARTALIGLGPAGAQAPALVVEPLPGGFPRTAAARARFDSELRALGAGTSATAGISRFFYQRKLPVDSRHNAKIHRLALARKWAARDARG
ncbi:MAG: AMP-binding protein [Puniceicoccales bacterium]|jgi:acyl-CoA synthetase (AMP-forming)/AMP-acid ligase II|nr:AMP-binding protein [Puniceicoccales bacterium]